MATSGKLDHIRSALPIGRRPRAAAVR